MLGQSCPNKEGLIDQTFLSIECDYGSGQQDRERGTLAVLAGYGNVAAHQPTELSADGEAQSGTAVLVTGRRLCLRKSFEEAAELSLCHADSRVSNRK